MLLRELTLAGARRVSLSSWALYSAGIYISLSLCVSLLFLYLSPCVFMSRSPPFMHLSPFFSLSLEDVLQLLLSCLSPNRIQIPSPQLIFCLQPHHPQLGLCPSQARNSGFPLEQQALLGVSPVHRQDIGKKGGKGNKATGPREDEPPRF